MAASLNLAIPRLASTHTTADECRKRLALFLSWLLLVAWLFVGHVLWRDEVRAFSLALSGADLGAMLANVHGEGHPALWYLILRAAHDLFPTREVLPVIAVLIGIAAMGLFTFLAPLRLSVIALALFSLFGAVEYVIVARNYGIAALVMFSLAALYPRVKNRAWLGVLLAVLANTNVPSAFLAAAFLLYRFVELLTGPTRASPRDWMVLGLNAALSLIGAAMCFALVYPPLNDGAVSTNYTTLGLSSLPAALADGDKGFSNLVLNAHGLVPPLLLWAACFAFRRPPALVAALAALAGLKLFFFFVYPSAYRHEALFVVFLLALYWIDVQATGEPASGKPWMAKVQHIGTAAFLLLIAAQTADLAKPLYLRVKAIPYSRSADVAHVLEQPGLKGAIVMADPDIMLEPLPYYTDNPLWFLREERFGKIFLKTRADRQQISLDDVLADAAQLHARFARPVVILLHADLRKMKPGVYPSFYRNSTVVTRGGVSHFLASTRRVAHLAPAITDESYDLYLYPSG